jgi:hypothetical protein
MATGLRFAFSARSLGTSSVVASIGGTVVVVATLAGTLTFGVSLRRFVDEPARYGTNFDYMLDTGADELPREVIDTLLAQPVVGELTEYVGGLARSGASTIAVAGSRTVRGALLPPLLEGRMPATPDEVALGRRSARDLEVSVGDTIPLTLDETSASYVVTGITIPPRLRGNDVVGHGAVMTADGYARLDGDAAVIAAAVALGEDATAADAARLAETFGVTPDDAAPDRPPAVRNVARVTFVPFLLAIVLALLVVLSIAGSVWGSIRRQSRPCAVLRSLGAEQRWISSTARWQGALWTTLPLVVGIPSGIICGRIVFRRFASGIGGVDHPAVPAVVMSAVVVSVIALAVAVATPASHRARTHAPAVALRAE